MEINKFIKVQPAKKVYLIVYFLMITLCSFSQPGNPNVISFNQYLNNNGFSNRITSNNGTDLEKYVFKLQDRIYIESSTIEKYGTNPLVVSSNVINFSSLMTGNYNKHFIKTIILKINSISDISNIDLSNLHSFPNLEFVLFYSSVQITTTDFGLVNFDTDNNIEFVYLYDKPF